MNFEARIKKKFIVLWHILPTSQTRTTRIWQ